MTTQKKIKIAIFIFLFVVLSPIIVLYANGDIFSNGWSLLQTGGIYVRSAPVGSEVYLNNKLQDKVTFFKRDILIKNLTPNTYVIQVKKADYNTWTKKLKVENNLVADADVFMLPENVQTKEIPEYIPDSSDLANSEEVFNQTYADTLTLFTSTTTKISKALSIIGIDFKNNLGTEKSPIMNGNLGLWKEKGKIFVKWFGSNETAPKYLCDQSSDCTEDRLVFELPKEPTEINFLSGYDGVILLSNEGLLFAVQAEDNPDKMIQILYKGKNPEFRLNDGDLYVKDGSTLSEILL